MSDTPGPLTVQRRHLAEQLKSAGLEVDAFVPETLAPPCVAIEPAEDYLTHGETYDLDEWWLTLHVFALVDLVGNQQAAEDLDDLLARLVPALGDAWELAAVSKPAPWHTSQWLAHGVRLTVRTLVHLTPTTQENP